MGGWVAAAALTAAACELVVGDGDYRTDDGGGLDDSSATSSGASSSGVSGGSGGGSSSGVSGSGSGSGVSSGSGGSSATACTLAPNSCTGGQTCLDLSMSDGTLYANCTSPGTAAGGASCTEDSDCVAGMGCFGSTGNTTCAAWCQLMPTATACGSGTACQPTEPAEVIGTTTYGVCLPGGVGGFAPAGESWYATLSDTSPTCEALSGSETVSFTVVGTDGLTLTTSSGCTYDWIVSGNTATIVPSSAACEYVDNEGFDDLMTFTSNTWTLTSATTATIAATYTITSDGVTCDYTRSGAATLM